MKDRNASNFFLGFIIGALICAVVWYWQKSTSSDEGALDVLDRLAASEAQLQAMRARETTEPAPAAEKVDDLTRIAGIGPVFQQRLQEMGISSFAALARQTPEVIMARLELRPWRQEAVAGWIAEAAALAEA